MRKIAIKDVCRLEKGKQIDTEQLSDSHSYKYINGGIKESGYYHDYNTQGNTVIISEGGASCGYVNYVNEPFWCGCHCYRLTDSSVMPKYLYFAIKAKQDEIMLLRTGSAMPNIKKSTLAEFQICVDETIEGQLEVVAKLENIENLILYRNEQLSKLDELVKSRFIELFGDPVINPKGYVVRKLGDISTKISDGVHAKPVYTETGKPFISVVNINTGKLNFDGCKYVSEEAYQAMIKSTHPEKGDVLYTKVGATYGIPAYVDTDREFCLYVSVSLIKPKHEEINARFLALSMGMPYVKQQSDSRIKGIGVPDLHLNQIREFDIICPPRHEQEAYVAFVEQTDKLKFEIKQSFEKLETLKKSLLQKYFG